ncbi:MAG: MATE family efflux transporter [Acholeplasmataceae bacterium]
MKQLEKNIFKISWPIFLELLFFTLLGTVDTIMLSNYSDTAVGSVGVSNRILNLIAILVNIVAAGIGVVVAQYLGANQIKKAKDAAVTGVVGNFILGIFLSGILIFFGEWFIHLIGTNDIFIDDSVIYLKIVGFSTLFISLRVGLSTIFRSFSHPKVVMYIMGVGNLVNIVMNAILIYGLFGIPSLGVEGAAIGTLVARIVMVILLIIYTYKILNIKLHKIRFYVEHLKKILFVGIPSALENVMYNIAQIIILVFVNRMVPDAVIAQSYIALILSFVFIFSFSFAIGNSIIVGYYIGEGEFEKAHKETNHTIKIAFITLFVVTSLLNIFAYPLISLFTSNPEITKMIRQVLYLSLFIEIGRSMNLVFISALRSAGDTIFPVVMAVISMFGISVVFSYLFGLRLELGILGVFIATAMDEIFRGFSMFIRWQSKKWMNMNLLNIK